ncbi:reverse transcriptase domain-containing protein, partial [Tanacetum coccineum]
IISRFLPNQYYYPERKLTMEEILSKFIEEGKKEHEEMETFIKEFQTTNELLKKEQNNLLSELRIGALVQMPKCAKYLKGLLTNKLRLEEACTITMNERCSTLLLNRLPSKEKDLGSFTIPCQVSNLRIDNALADLGASISLMSYTMYEKLGLGEPKPTRMSLELADRSIQYPRGIVENVLIKVEKFVLPIDFVILDMPENSRIPIILGRPFLATARAMIDRMIECYGIDELDVTIGEKTQEILEDNRSDSFEGLGGTTNQYDPKNSEQGNFNQTRIIEDGDLCSASANEIDEKKPELEDLPPQLEYAYLHGFFQIPIALEDQEKKTFTCPYGMFAYRRMLFGLCNAPMTFQRCMATVFHDMVEDFMEVFMDDFSVFDNSFNICLANLDQMLARCEETNLVLNLEKCHFMVKEGIVLGHKISRSGIEVDKAKIDVIAKLPYPTNVKGVRSFLGHAEIKDKKGAKNLAAVHLSRLENPNTENLAEEDIADKFPDNHLMMLKEKLIEAEPWYVDYINYLVEKVIPLNWTSERRKWFYSQGTSHQETKYPKITSRYAKYSTFGGLDFMGPFLDSRGNKYILVVVVYVSKRVEAQTLPTNDARIVEKFLRSLFARFGVPKALISDRGTHFCNSQLEKALQKYEVHYRVSTAYHPQSNGQTKVTNRSIKRILERSIG